MSQQSISHALSTAVRRTKLVTAATVTAVTAAPVTATLFASRVEAQSPNAILGASQGIPVGGDLNEYLRYLQTEGQVRLTPWGIRGFSPSVADSLTTITGNHPWKNSWMFHPENNRFFRVVPVDVTAKFNSAYPFGINEGPVWSGRGLTTAVSAGIAAAWGPISLVLKPVVFRAENQGFTLQPNGLTGDAVYANELFPRRVDLPQRFGNAAYTHVDPGESTLRLDAYGVSLGVTSANEWWGPASMFPYIVGNNAAGVPRVFFGTERPTNIWIGTFQVRAEYGMEFQSAYSPVAGSETYVSVDSIGERRLMSGLVAVFSPRGIPGLEIGAGRYFHRPWTGRVTGSDLKSPFAGILLASQPINDTTRTDASGLANQLGSLWARWVFPHSGVELYGEYGHEDHNIDLADLEAELDHSRTALLGFRKTFRRDSQTVNGVRIEIFDGTASTNARHRDEGLIYVHTPIRQGHTEEGKLIGAAAGVGSPAAMIVAWDRYRPSGRSTLYLVRTTENTAVTGAEDTSSSQTHLTLGAEILRFQRMSDLSIGAAVTHSSGIVQGPSPWNAMVTFGIRSHAF
jgi:hypothetical protein